MSLLHIGDVYCVTYNNIVYPIPDIKFLHHGVFGTKLIYIHNDIIHLKNLIDGNIIVLDYIKKIPNVKKLITVDNTFYLIFDNKVLLGNGDTRKIYSYNTPGVIDIIHNSTFDSQNDYDNLRYKTTKGYFYDKEELPININIQNVWFRNGSYYYILNNRIYTYNETNDYTAKLLYKSYTIHDGQIDHHTICEIGNEITIINSNNVIFHVIVEDISYRTYDSNVLIDCIKSTDSHAIITFIDGEKRICNARCTIKNC